MRFTVEFDNVNGPFRLVGFTLDKIPNLPVVDTEFPLVCDVFGAIERYLAARIEWEGSGSSDFLPPSGIAH